ncbi:MAG: extracellular solute-binding protein [Aquamicrobium sp.]|uniref:extracellular solute-binding protein n=1 Tax=Aquamicrobium sp. TaxID=1872579 RepID=UPI00349EC856|nr:extracellular solute-binding protein [Aquamicrobium sp.]
MPSNWKLNRRQIMALGAGAGVAALGAMGRAHAARPLVVATWGGDNERTIRESAGAMFQSRYGAAPLFETGTPSARKTKLMAEAARPVHSLDIVHLTDADLFQMQRQGFLAEIGAHNVSKYDTIIDQFRTGYSVPTNFSALVLVYNKNHISSMTSWKDLWKKEYAGKIGFSDLTFNQVVPIASAVFGSGITDYASGYEALMALKENGVRTYPSNEAVGNAFASEEIIAGIQWKGRAVQWSQAGLPLAYAMPSEGAFPASFDMGIVRNSGAPENAARFLDIMLEQEPQLALARAIGQSPVIKNSGIPADLEAAVGFSEKERAEFLKLDLEYAADHDSEVLDWWNQKFKG